MFEITIEDHFSAAHYLTEYDGKCERVHGHNYVVQVTVKGSKRNKAGLVMDFGTLKGALAEILSELDHHLLNDLEPFQEMSVSSENIAEYLYGRLAPEVDTEDVKVSKVAVWESPTSCAAFVPAG